MNIDKFIDILAKAIQKEEDIVGSKKFRCNSSLQVKTKDGTYINIILHKLEDTIFNLIDGKSYSDSVYNWCEKNKES